MDTVILKSFILIHILRVLVFCILESNVIGSDCVINHFSPAGYSPIEGTGLGLGLCCV